MYNTKTRGGAEVVSKQANFLEFSPTPNKTDVGNKNPIGLPSIKQTSEGIWYPTVQAAIDDLSSMVLGNINDVVINTDGVSPQGVQQISQIEFAGGPAVVRIQEGDDSSIKTKWKVNILGFTIEVENGDAGSLIATKLKAEADKYIAENSVIDQAQIDPTNARIITLRHIDYQPHELKSFSFFGITANMTVISPARTGHGDWYKMGQEAKTFDGATQAVTLHYFKRIA